MTKSAKIAVSLPPEQVVAAKRAVAEGRATSVSAYVSEAMAMREREESLSDLVTEWLAEDGKPGPEAYAWADRVLAKTPRSARKSGNRSRQ